VGQDPTNAVWQRDLAVSLNNLGDIYRGRGDLEAALKAYQQSLEINRRLAGQDPTNASWQRNLADSYDNVGDVLAAQGKLQEALDAHQQSLKIRQILAEQDKSNSGWQRDLIVSLYNVGTAKAMIAGNDNIAQAQDFLRTALNLADKYSGPDRQQLIDRLNKALQNLAH
jgi:tetratricopeptide (TPR) repeat protein